MYPSTVEGWEGFALWLVPPAPLAARLAAVIDELAARYGTPRFPPHVTLRSRLREIPPLEELAASLRSLTLRPLRVTAGSSLYQCVFVELAREDPRLPRDPHLSLIYGDLDAATRAEIAATVTVPMEPFPAAALWAVEIVGSADAWPVKQRIAI